MKIITITISILITMFLVSNNKAFSQINNREQQIIEAWDFAHWEGRYGQPTNGIDLYKIRIPSLTDLVLLSDGKKFKQYLSHNRCDIVFTDSKWEKSDTEYVYINIYFTYTNEAAQRYLLDRFVYENSMPVSLIEKAKDSTSFVGDVSLFYGGIFVRNNTVVIIDAKGSLKNRTLQIAKEIDSVLINQKKVKDTKLIRPKIVKVKDSPDFILEPLEDEQ